MLNIGLAELILVLLVAFLVVGPKDLPKVARALARFVRYLKAKWAEFIEETDMGDTIDELKGVRDDLKESVRQVDPSADLKKTENDLNSTVNDIKKAVKIKKHPVDQ